MAPRSCARKPMYPVQENLLEKADVNSAFSVFPAAQITTFSTYRPTCRRINSGFSLIELITVLILIGVVSVVAVARFSGSDGFAEYTYQNRLISALRNMQTRAMHDSRPGFCFRINLVNGATTPAFGPPSINYSIGNQANTCASGIDQTNDFLATTPTEITSERLALTTIDSAMTNVSFIGFNGLGQPLTDIANCAAGCRVTFEGTGSASVCVTSEGYIHAC